jgi:small subunit ribosomal protein S3
VGQKVHPTGFRLIILQKYFSYWYALKKNYLILSQEDYKFRKKIERIFSPFLSIAKIEINRKKKKNQENIDLVLYTLFPEEKEILQKILDSLKKEKNLLIPLVFFDSQKNEINEKKLLLILIFVLKQIIRNFIYFFHKNQKYLKFKIKFFKNVFESGSLIGQYIGEQLKKRVTYRRILKLTILKVKQTGFFKGVKIQLSGRLNGLEIARTEWKKEGQLSLQTLASTIDYNKQNINTIYGIIGVKIWLFNI